MERELLFVDNLNRLRQECPKAALGVLSEMLTQSKGDVAAVRRNLLVSAGVRGCASPSTCIDMNVSY